VDHRLLVGIVLFVALLLLAMAYQEATSEDRRSVILLDDGEPAVTIDASVADTSRERSRGLGGTESLAQDEGMLFVFRMERTRTFVMRNVSYPLDIIFIGADRRITRIHTAEPEYRPYTKHRGRAKWVLEVPAGVAADHGIEPGDRIRFATAD
jgi:uncharacterized membrane protein (UPF0127 family)